MTATATRERLMDIARTIFAAANTRCACGAKGTWDRTVRGHADGVACVWASCSNANHTGAAIGVPITRSDLNFWKRCGNDGIICETIARDVVAARCSHLTVSGVYDLSSRGREGQYRVTLKDKHGDECGAMTVVFDGVDLIEVK